MYQIFLQRKTYIGSGTLQTLVREVGNSQRPQNPAGSATLLPAHENTCSIIKREKKQTSVVMSEPKRNT